MSLVGELSAGHGYFEQPDSFPFPWSWGFSDPMCYSSLLLGCSGSLVVVVWISQLVSDYSSLPDLPSTTDSPWTLASQATKPVMFDVMLLSAVTLKADVSVCGQSQCRIRDPWTVYIRTSPTTTNNKALPPASASSTRWCRAECSTLFISSPPICRRPSCLCLQFPLHQNRSADVTAGLLASAELRYSTTSSHRAAPPLYTTEAQCMIHEASILILLRLLCLPRR